MTPNGADVHLLDMVEDVVADEGPMTADEIAARLAEEGMAVAVIAPGSIEEYERDGEPVGLVRGGSHRALSSDAMERRLRRMHSGFKRREDGRWELIPEEERAGRALAGGDD